MRKISYEAALAFCHNAHYKNDNTEVVVSERDCMTVMRLRGHIIATRVGVRVRVTLAGYGTPTTRERVNGLLTVLADEFNWPHSCGFTQCKGEQVFITHASDGEVIHREVVNARDFIEFDIDNGFYRVVC